jgi:pimeloyl-ACP methyl ester carboxylesterase
MRSTPFELPNRSGLPLRGDTRCIEGSARLPVVVVCHGFKGFKDWGCFPYVRDRFAEAGFLAVGFNFSGSGVGADLENFTELDRFAADTISAQVDDLRCVLDAVDSGAIGAGRADARRIAVLGHSRGGGDAILCAHRDRRIRAVITWAGISTTRRWSDAEARDWRARGYTEVLNSRTGQVLRMNTTFLDDVDAHADQLDILKAVAGLEAPLLVVHGEDDTSVPVSEARALHGAARPGRAELLTIAGTGHTFGAVHPWKGPTPELNRALEHSVVWLLATLAGLHEGSAQR